jgi:hypothetical protein
MAGQNCKIPLAGNHASLDGPDYNPAARRASCTLHNIYNLRHYSLQGVQTAHMWRESCRSPSTRRTTGCTASRVDRCAAGASRGRDTPNKRHQAIAYVLQCLEIAECQAWICDRQPVAPTCSLRLGAACRIPNSLTEVPENTGKA